MQFCVLTRKEYQTFEENHPYRDFMNSVNAMDLKLMNNWQVDYVGVKDDQDKILCATVLTSIPVMKIFRFYYAQRGFLIDYHNLELLSFFTKELKSFLKTKKCLYMTADPNVLYKERDIDGNLVEGGFDNSYVVDNLKQCGYIHQGFTNDYSVISQIRWMFSLYLKDKDEKTVLKEMHQQTRWSINKTIKQGIAVREMSIDEIDVFMKMMEHTAERRNFTARKQSFYESQLKAFGDKAKLLLAYLDLNDFRNKLNAEKAELDSEMVEIKAKLNDMPNNKKFLNKEKVCQEALDLNAKKYVEADELEKNYGKVIPMASSFFIIEDDQTVYLYSAAYDDFKKYNAPYAIQWYMIRYALEHHINRYNFYGISGNFSEDAEDYGVYEFKRGFSGVVEELVGDFTLPVNKFMYKVYRLIKK